VRSVIDSATRTWSGRRGGIGSTSRDWADLRRAVLDDRSVLQSVLRIARARESDPHAQRYHFWRQYVERRLA